MEWEIVMGLEVHAELSTKSKIFCGCTTEFGGEPNTHVCPVCSGMPGTLPRLNKSVAEYAMRLGTVLNCDIIRDCKFDRKNYFYPDLPKAYQVSQLYFPICRNGYLEIDGGKKIRIHEIHMEEDAGKLIHDAYSGGTFMDFNRCGVPLLEIVSEPDFRTPDEVVAYLTKLREILLYLGICDCKMQEGSIRADVNLSVHKVGEPFGVRTEMKNLNSFRFITHAIEAEAKRQIAVLESGGEIFQETRRWDDVKGESFAMRSKENAQEYRYFPEPDLLPIHISDQWLDEVKKSIPELAHQMRERYVRDYKLTEFEAGVLTSHRRVSDLFEALCAKSGEPVESARLITGEIMRLMNTTNTLAEDLDVDAEKIATLIKLVTAKKINRNAYKEVVEEVFINNIDPDAYIKQKGLLMVTDDSAVEAAVTAVLEANAGAIEDYRAGKDRAFGFLVGQCMKQLKGSGNPESVRKILTDKLSQL